MIFNTILNFVLLVSPIISTFNKFNENQISRPSGEVRTIDNIYNFINIKYNNFHGWKILFFGDLIFDRGVLATLTGENAIKKHFKYRDTQEINYDGEITNFNNISKYYDFIGLNLETPIGRIHSFGENGNEVQKKFCPKTDKTIAFCSSDKILPFLKKMGFNIFALANNHSMDGGVTAHLSTIEVLNNYGFNYFGYIKHGRYFDKNYVFTGSKQGNLFAWHSFDFTIYGGKHLEQFCSVLKDYKKDGYNNFLSVHRGTEYRNKHNSRQEKIGKHLIDCGADFIIGTHPHVVQDIGIYNGKYIIYSLGNFLFDQGHRQDTQTGSYAIIEYPFTGSARIFTGLIDSYVR